MEITGGKLKRNETNENAMGGTELMATRLFDSFEPEFFNEFQIVFSRLRELDASKCRLYYAHDLPGDPESDNALKDGGWKRFHRLIFVSNWQMQNFVMHYQLPFNKCMVMQNAIEPIEPHKKPEGPIRLGYWSTPHRGLNILVPVFEALAEKHDIQLDVYSSFSLYGWDARDEHFEELFERCRNHPKINYHGALDNKALREELKQIHILAYPNTWVETSCLVLMEAMSAGIQAVHPNLGALFETAANWTSMYQFVEDQNQHANLFCAMLEEAIINYRSESTKRRLEVQKTYSDVFYSWPIRKLQWQNFLSSSVKDEDRTLEKPDSNYFHLKVT